MCRLAPAVLLLLPLLDAAGRGDVVIDDFAGYPDGSWGAPAWQPQSVGWRVAGGAMTASRATGAILCRKAGYGRSVTVEATVTVTGEGSGDWLVAGLEIQQDRANAWRLNLVRAPKAQQFAHHTELHELHDGVWLAESLADTSLEQLARWTADGWSWDPGVPYRLRLSLGGGRVEGTISSGDGKPLARFAYGLSNNAVDCGWAGLSASMLDATYDDVRIEVDDPVAPPPDDTAVEPYDPYIPIQPDAPVVSKGTGYFRVEQSDGRWWVIDPTGRRMFMVGTDHCNYDAHWCDKLGYAPYHRNCEARYGSAEAWAESATSRLKEWSFNLLGAGSHPSTHRHGLAYTDFASLGSGFARREWIAEPINWTGFPDVFSEEFEAYCGFVASGLTGRHRGDPWLFGYFLDNELEWFGKTGRLADDVFLLGPDRPAKKALVRWLVDTLGSVQAVNDALGTNATSADELAAVTTPPATELWYELANRFLGVIAERYFGVTCAAIREADSDHMILGCRFAGIAPAGVLSAASKHVDIFTINTYPRVDLAGNRVLDTPEMLADLYGAVARPMMITEWSFPALDAGLPSQHGAGMRVDTQEQKAHCYDVFATMIAQLPFMVGYDYFMWVDEPALGISSTFPEDSNYGLVDVDDKPWDELVRVATEVNGRAAADHASCPLELSWVTQEPVGPVPQFGPADIPGAQERTVAEFAWDLGPLQAAHAAGSAEALSDIRCRDFELGRLHPLLQESIGGGSRWIAPSHTVLARLWEGGGVHLADLELAFEPPPGGEERAFHVGYRLLARDGLPCVLAKLLWIENADQRPLDVVACFHYLLPSIGGDPKDDDVGGPAAPNYYLESCCWTDKVLGGTLGLAPYRGSDFQLMFWKSEDGGFHSDVRREINVKLAHGERWESDEPWVAAYGFAPDERNGWREVARADAPWKRWLGTR